MPPVDWLSRLLAITPVSGQLEIRCSYRTPWRAIYERANAGEIPYHVVLGGSATMEIPGSIPRQLVAGDIVLLIRGSEHVLHGSGTTPLPAASRGVLDADFSENCERGKVLDMLCGRFILTPPHDRLLCKYLPPTLVVRLSEVGHGAQRCSTANRLVTLVGLMRDESASYTLGGYATLNALSAALFALALRMAGESESTGLGLLALAGQQRLEPALTAMLNEPARPWTLPDLAKLCDISRTTLIRDFRDKVGCSINDLLTDIRMTLAVNELKNPSSSTETVAQVVGYQSVAAFRRTFAKRMGMTPGKWRRAARRR
ncbi:AraC family transcriptional regulator [Paraburkholderia oxyphila]|uniref:AraC family transcriptional regulator n=1 Tax=Paraburkholderia oxyphila TaxID=614212 RepID=UPI0004829CEC|nr:AraC family transcriptional regulator [Paraburkholderia oxyphila]